MRFTIDASVHLNALNPDEEGSAASQEFLRKVHHPAQDEEGTWVHQIVSPTLLPVEIAASVARVLDDTERGKDFAAATRELPGQRWVALDDSLAQEAWILAAEHRLRGADAVYAAVACRARTFLVTRDGQQLKRLRPRIPTWSPEEALRLLGEESG